MRQSSVLFVVGVISLTSLMIAAAPVWACDAAGPNTHVGVVKQLDAKSKRLTIKDAQTGKPMVFVAESTQLAALNIGDQVAVKYEDHNGVLTAKQIQ